MTFDRRAFLRLGSFAAACTLLLRQPGADAASTESKLPTERKSFCVDVGPLVGADSTITDFSGFHYCSAVDSLLLFGGGNAATPEDVVLRFPIEALKWSGDYTATPKSTMLQLQDGKYRYLTKNKFWSAPGAVPPIRPVSRHTYSGFIWSEAIRRMVLPMQNGGTYYGFSNETVGGTVAEYDPVTRTWEDTGVDGCPGELAFCEDPVSGVIVAHSSEMFRVYDPRRRVWTANLPNGTPNFGYAANLVYYPPNDRFYYISRNIDPNVRSVRVWEYELDRRRRRPIYRVPIGANGGEPMPTNWRPSPKGGITGTAFAYDAKNKLIVGGLFDGTMLGFRPNGDGTGTWLQHPAPEATQQTFYCMDYVPRIDTHLLICEVHGKGKRTFAFRWDPSEASPTVDPLGNLPRATITPAAESLQGACDVARVVTLGPGALLGVQASAHPRNPVQITGQDTKLISGGIEGKGIIVTGVDTTLVSLDISGATVNDGNGAGVRHEGGALSLRHVALHDCQNGILGPARDIPASVAMDACEVHDNGTGTGQTHGVYIGRISRFDCINSRFRDTNIGHHVKSRAAATSIRNCEIGMNFDGNESYNVDIPDGGDAVISNCVMRQGPRTDNSIMVNYGSEPHVYSGGSLRIERCRFESKAGGIGIRNALAQVVAEIRDCDFIGLEKPIVGAHIMRNCRLDGHRLPDVGT